MCQDSDVKDILDQPQQKQYISCLPHTNIFAFLFHTGKRTLRTVERIEEMF